MDVFNIYTHAHSEHYFVSLKQAILNAFHFLFALFYRPCREKKCIYCFFTTNIVIDVAVKFKISSFSRNQAKNMRENKKNSNNNNSATEWWGKKMCVWWTECVVNGWDDMHTVHHCVINKIQINVKSPESPKLTTATTEKDEERWEEVFPYYITIGRALALSAVHVLLLWPTSSDKNGTNDKEKKSTSHNRKHHHQQQQQQQVQHVSMCVVLEWWR